MNFISNLLDKLLTDKEKELVPICLEAYEVEFEPHHTWIVKKLARQAFKWVGTRKDCT